MRLFDADALLRNLKAGFGRFPIPLSLAVAQTVLWMLITAGADLDLGIDANVHLTIFATLAVLFSTAVALRAEFHGWPRAKLFRVTGAGLVALAAYVAWVPNPGDFQITGTVGFLVPALILLIMVGPVAARTVDNDQVWAFNQSLGFAVAFGFLGATILSLGLSAAFGALDFLLDLDVGGVIFADSFIISYCLVWPWLSLATLPRHTPESLRITLTPQFQFIVRRILMPLAVLYFAILYAYIAKIVIEWSLPKGGVAYLVGGYVGFGVIVHLLAYPGRDSFGPVVRLFHSYFYLALIPPLALLIVGVATRINQYGLTENRYALVVLALWLVITVAYHVFQKQPRIITAQAMLAVLLALASFGPWGASRLSTYDQLGRLKILLAKHQMLDDGKATPAAADLPVDDVREIGAVVTYFLSQGKQRELVPLFADSEIDFSSYPGHSDIMAAINLDYIPVGAEFASFNFYTTNMEPLAVAGYDHLWRSSLANGERKWTETLPPTDDGSRFTLFFDPQLSQLVVQNADGDGATFDLGQLIDRLRAAGLQEVEAPALALEALSANGALRARIQFNYLNGNMQPNGPRITYIDFQLLIDDRAAQPPG